MGAAAQWLCNPFTYAHTPTMSHQHSWSAPPQPPPPHLLVCIPLYSIHCICSSRYPGRDSAAARPCDQPQCCPDVCSALFQQRKNLVVTALETDWLQHSINPPPLSWPTPLQIEADRSPLFPFFTSPQFLRSFEHTVALFLLFFHSPSLLFWVLCWQAHTNPCDFHTRDAESGRKGQGMRARRKKDGARKCKGDACKRWQLTRKCRVVAERGDEKANQQLVTHNCPRGGLLTNEWVMSRGMGG